MHRNIRLIKIPLQIKNDQRPNTTVGNQSAPRPHPK